MLADSLTVSRQFSAVLSGIVDAGSCAASRRALIGFALWNSSGCEIENMTLVVKMKDLRASKSRVNAGQCSLPARSSVVAARGGGWPSHISGWGYEYSDLGRMMVTARGGRLQERFEFLGLPEHHLFQLKFPWQTSSKERLSTKCTTMSQRHPDDALARRSNK
jgi:hypothetical protein